MYLGKALRSIIPKVIGPVLTGFDGETCRVAGASAHILCDFQDLDMKSDCVLKMSNAFQDLTSSSAGKVVSCYALALSRFGQQIFPGALGLECMKVLSAPQKVADQQVKAMEGFLKSRLEQIISRVDMIISTVVGFADSFVKGLITMALSAAPFGPPTSPAQAARLATERVRLARDAKLALGLANQSYWAIKMERFASKVGFNLKDVVDGKGYVGAIQDMATMRSLHAAWLASRNFVAFARDELGKAEDSHDTALGHREPDGGGCLPLRCPLPGGPFAELGNRIAKLADTIKDGLQMASVPNPPLPGLDTDVPNFDMSFSLPPLPPKPSMDFGPGPVPDIQVPDVPVISVPSVPPMPAMPNLDDIDLPVQDFGGEQSPAPSPAPIESLASSTGGGIEQPLRALEDKDLSPLARAAEVELILAAEADSLAELHATAARLALRCSRAKRTGEQRAYCQAAPRRAAEHARRMARLVAEAAKNTATRIAIKAKETAKRAAAAAKDTAVATAQAAAFTALSAGILPAKQIPEVQVAKRTIAKLKAKMFKAADAATAAMDSCRARTLALVKQANTEMEAASRAVAKTESQLKRLGSADELRDSISAKRALLDQSKAKVAQARAAISDVMRASHRSTKERQKAVAWAKADMSRAAILADEQELQLLDAGLSLKEHARLERVLARQSAALDACKVSLKLAEREDFVVAKLSATIAKTVAIPDDTDCFGTMVLVSKASSSSSGPDPAETPSASEDKTACGFMSAICPRAATAPHAASADPDDARDDVDSVVWAAPRDSGLPNQMYSPDPVNMPFQASVGLYFIPKPWLEQASGDTCSCPCPVPGHSRLDLQDCIDLAKQQQEERDLDGADRRAGAKEMDMMSLYYAAKGNFDAAMLVFEPIPPPIVTE
ncbi:hypothetical protein FNF27_05654 [Cafeteria roenbergensis]|uniref:Uncharacterized protein n=3 Tax=Cafeteria roenbergensis TaxID=33653 RepID=A0A5A8E601_CAFRO|nr:hypothetical protein FNF27_05654 [Cafeteria roenbergensis]